MWICYCSCKAKLLTAYWSAKRAAKLDGRGNLDGHWRHNKQLAQVGLPIDHPFCSNSPLGPYSSPLILSTIQINFNHQSIRRLCVRREGCVSKSGCTVPYLQRLFAIFTRKWPIGRSVPMLLLPSLNYDAFAKIRQKAVEWFGLASLKEKLTKFSNSYELCTLIRCVTKNAANLWASASFPFEWVKTNEFILLQLIAMSLMLRSTFNSASSNFCIPSQQKVASLTCQQMHLTANGCYRLASRFNL